VSSLDPSLLNPERPDDRRLLLATHPVITRWFKIPTPPLQRMFDRMLHLITSGAPGGAFVAYPRFGKSYAASYCTNKLAEIMPSTPVIQIHAHHEQRPTQQRFYLDLLEQSGLAGGNARKRNDDARIRLVRGWYARAIEHGSDTLVLIADEMQCVTAEGYSWIIDISNDLHALKVRMITIVFGQPELESLRTTFKEMHRGDILGRFLARFFAFEGIGSAVELREVMRYYDTPEGLVYPEHSDWCFTRFFLPQAYANGWRLSSCAGELWAQFEKRATPQLSPSGRVQPFSVGMEWVAGAIQYALVNNWDLDSPRLKLTRQEWSAAVDSTGFGSSLGLTYAP
jgi:hypothetical protein